MQNEGTGKSSWWMLNPDALPITGHTRRNSGGTGGGGGSCGGGLAPLHREGGPNSGLLKGSDGSRGGRRRANTLDPTISRPNDKQARRIGGKVGGRKRGDSGSGPAGRLHTNGYASNTTYFAFLCIFKYEINTKYDNGACNKTTFLQSKEGRSSANWIKWFFGDGIVNG